MFLNCILDQCQYRRKREWHSSGIFGKRQYYFSTDRDEGTGNVLLTAASSAREYSAVVLHFPVVTLHLSYFQYYRDSCRFIKSSCTV